MSEVKETRSGLWLEFEPLPQLQSGYWQLGEPYPRKETQRESNSAFLR